MRIQNRFEKWLRLIYHLLFFIFTAIILFVCLLREHVQNCQFQSHKKQIFIQKLPRTWCLKNVNFVKIEISVVWILRKMRLQKCEFCEKWVFINVNFVKIEISATWILWKLRFQKGEFCKNCYFQNVNFWIKCGYLPQCAHWCGNLSPKLCHCFWR